MQIYLKLIWAYIKIGIFGFGGGYAMLSLVEKAVVGPGWISETMFTDIVAISQMTPGPIGINSATYIGFVAPGAVNPEFSGIGWGLIGSILATLAVTVPSFFLVLYSAHFIRRHNESGAVKAVFSGGNHADERRQLQSERHHKTDVDEHRHMRHCILPCIFPAEVRQEAAKNPPDTYYNPCRHNRSDIILLT